jgi:hypothetical protein
MAFQTKALSDKGFHAHRFPASFQFGVELGRNRISLSADALLSDTHGHLQAFTHAATLLGDEPLRLAGRGRRYTSTRTTRTGRSPSTS